MFVYNTQATHFLKYGICYKTQINIICAHIKTKTICVCVSERLIYISMTHS